MAGRPSRAAVAQDTARCRQEKAINRPHECRCRPRASRPTPLTHQPGRGPRPTIACGAWVRAAGRWLGPEVIAQVSARKSTGMAVAIVPANDRLRSLVSGSARPPHSCPGRGRGVRNQRAAVPAIGREHVCCPAARSSRARLAIVPLRSEFGVSDPRHHARGGCTAADAFDVSARSARRLAPAAWVARPQMPRRCGRWHKAVRAAALACRRVAGALRR